MIEKKIWEVSIDGRSQIEMLYLPDFANVTCPHARVATMFRRIPKAIGRVAL
jgi:hypothetical protein